jgi:hypothetical protein
MRKTSVPAREKADDRPPPPEEIVMRMAASLAKRFAKLDEWSRAIGPSARLRRHPLRVQHLQKEQELYYIVSVGGTGSADTARFALSGDTGHLLEAEAIDGETTALPRYCDPMKVVARYFEGAGAPVRPYPLDLVGRHPVLVWKPCLESTSRLLPFWLLTIRDTFLYVRVDGQIFRRLTTTGRG